MAQTSLSKERELRQFLQEVKQRDVKEFLLQKGDSWYFNLPSASHMGGLWKRVIRSVHKILKGLIGEKTLNPRNSDLLTPTHLLLRMPNQNLPPGIFSKSDVYSKQRKQQMQYLADQFWKSWVNENLSLMQQRQK
ncbi:hypothetical protein HOLleu_12050 [Holothuria leucospilota]|uniref:DUF5641 domain-containing protein n=1 Tax=Holothuria leucospilota TaxID=206669 RepID=A0A9Q1HDH1_HOLLE|nr:hypothetical protein HOLleu_12050 [Holothuria leucospilota]